MRTTATPARSRPLRPWAGVLLVAAVLLGQAAAWWHQVGHWADGPATGHAHALHSGPISDRAGRAANLPALPESPWAAPAERARWAEWSRWAPRGANGAALVLARVAAAAPDATTPSGLAPAETRQAASMPASGHADTACTLCLAFAGAACGAPLGEEPLVRLDGSEPAPLSVGLAAAGTRAAEAARIRGPPHATA